MSTLDKNINLLKGLSQIHSLLSVGLYQNKNQLRVADSIKLVEEMHKALADETMKLDGASDAPELAELFNVSAETLKANVEVVK